MLIELSSAELSLIDRALKLYWQSNPGNYIHYYSIVNLTKSIESQMKVSRKRSND